MIRSSTTLSITSVILLSVSTFLIDGSFNTLFGAGSPVSVDNGSLNNLDPQVPPSWVAARDLYDRARYEEARQMLDLLIERGNITAEVLYYRGLVEPEALIAIEQYFDRIIQRYEGSEIADRARYKIAIFRYDSGYYMAARRELGKVMVNQGDSPLGQSARYWRGMTWLHSSNQPDSLRIGLTFIKDAAARATDPDIKGRALLTIAELNLRLNEPDSALVYATEVIDAPYLDDYHPGAMGIMARGYNSLGNVDQARLLNQTLLSRFPDTWEGREARRWLAQQREAAVQARLDTMRAMGGRGITQTGAGKGRWTIQEGAYSDMSNATVRVMQLTRGGYNAWHTSKRVDGILYVVVLIGRFETQTEARAFGNSLIAENIITNFQLYDILPP